MRSCRRIWTLIFFLLASWPVTADWRQWRGDEGAGVTQVGATLPVEWAEDGPEVLWRTDMPGEGISSPIVSDGRVFVTTAYEGSDAQRLQGVLVVATVGLVLLFVLLLLKARATWLLHSGRMGDRLDRYVVIGASLGTLLLATALAIAPGALLEAGNPGRSWRIGSAIVLLGVAAAFGWSGRRAHRRLLGALIVFVVALALIRLGPTGPLGPARFSKWIPFLFPGCATAAWYVVGFVWGRSADELPTNRESLVAALPAILLVVATLAFVPTNFFMQLQRAIVCLDLESGEILWLAPVFSGPAEQKWHHNTYATPTPVADGDRVFAYFGHGLASVDREGRVEWWNGFPGYTHSTRYGAGASPVVAGGAVIVVREREINQEGPPSWIAAFEKSSGRELWRLEPPRAHDSYTTPVVVETGIGPLVVTASFEHAAAYRVDSGEPVWSVDYPMQQMVASPVRSGRLLAISGGSHSEKALLVFELDLDGDGSPELLWRASRGVATVSSPLIYNDMLFSLTTPGILTAFELETGEELWKKRLEGEHFASPVAGDGKIFATSTEGITSVLAAERESALLAENQLHGLVYASPAVTGDSLLIRSGGSLYRIGSR